MEQLSPQHVRSSLSGGQADSERTQFNARVRKPLLWNVKSVYKIAFLNYKVTLLVRFDQFVP